jgi:hypothetical protein
VSKWFGRCVPKNRSRGGKGMIRMPTLRGTFAPPQLVFTLAGNPSSEAVIKALGNTDCRARREIFSNPDDVRCALGDPNSALVLFDTNLSHRFHPTHRNRKGAPACPEWAHGAYWMVLVKQGLGGRSRGLSEEEAEALVSRLAGGIANQLAADFWRNFTTRMSDAEHPQFPWGSGRGWKMGRDKETRARFTVRLRNAEEPPQPVTLPDSIRAIVGRLNEGPNLAASMADAARAAELPEGSRISWLRVVPEPLQFDTETLDSVLTALRCFEQSCSVLVRQDEQVQQLLLAGVDLPRDSHLARQYLFPRVDHFSVSRPDLHYTGQELLPFGSELDEMPGGMPELVHLDHVYGINQHRWKRAFEWLCRDGRLVFLVSHLWSKCYVPETEWLVGHMQRMGYPVDLVTTDQLDRLTSEHDGWHLAGERVGTIWRQFPIFEVSGKLAYIVASAYQGEVRMFPEFAHFGNKTWFSLFRSHEDFYRKALDAKTFGILDEVIPHSYMVAMNGKSPFPIVMPGGIRFDCWADLMKANQLCRDRMVLKMTGANNKTARSYGVLMGVGIGADDWAKWLWERQQQGQPFLVQNRVEAGNAKVPVYNTKTQLAELFGCRILARPWSIDDRLVSVHGCAVPDHLYKVHGMTAMAVVPFAI